MPAACTDAEKERAMDLRLTWLKLIWPLLAGAILLASSGRLRAEDISVPDGTSADGVSEEADHADAAATEGSIPYKSLLSILRDGGLLMIPLFICSFLMLVFFFERVISLRRGRVIPAPFVKRLFHQLREGKLDRDGALDLCQESPSTASEVFAAVIKKWGRPSVEIEQTLIDAQERAAHVLRRYLRLFNAMSTLTPLMGLLGTVFGMIRLFNVVSHADAMGRTELLAGGISEAMLCTAGGLLIAIPSMCFYMLFTSRVERLLMDIDGLGQDLVGQISAEALQDHRSGRASRRGTTAA